MPETRMLQNVFGRNSPSAKLWGAIAFVTVLGPASAIASQSSTAATLQAMTQEMDDALAPGQTGVWERYTDPALVFVDENNEVSDRKKLLAGMKPLPKGYSGSIRVTDFVVRDFATVAISTYIIAETETVEGQTIHDSFRETDTWRTTPRGWRLIGAQEMAVNRDPPSIRLPAPMLAAYGGTYRLSAATEESIRTVGDHLVVARTGRPAQILLAEATDVFFTPGKPRTRRIFLHGRDGAVDGFADRREGVDVVWTRK